jgi:hypothetical protein
MPRAGRKLLLMMILSMLLPVGAVVQIVVTVIISVPALVTGARFFAHGPRHDGLLDHGHVDLARALEGPALVAGVIIDLV